MVPLKMKEVSLYKLHCMP